MLKFSAMAPTILLLGFALTCSAGFALEAAEREAFESLHNEYLERLVDSASDDFSEQKLIDYVENTVVVRLQMYRELYELKIRSLNVAIRRANALARSGAPRELKFLLVDSLDLILRGEESGSNTRWSDTGLSKELWRMRLDFLKARRDLHSLDEVSTRLPNWIQRSQVFSEHLPNEPLRKSFTAMVKFLQEPVPKGVDARTFYRERLAKADEFPSRRGADDRPEKIRLCRNSGR